MESSKYIQELKFAANKTGVAFGVANLTFSIEDFKSLVVSAKHVGYLYIMDSLIPLDCEFDFGEQLNFSNIGVFDVGNCCSENQEYWDKKPHRFENLIKAISNCLPLRKSLHTLNIGGCDISTKNAKKVCQKYGLKDLILT